MTRISWVFVAFACFIFCGCSPGTVEAPDEAEVKTTTPIEDDLKASGMENMTAEEYTGGDNQEE